MTFRQTAGEVLPHGRCYSCRESLMVRIARAAVPCARDWQDRPARLGVENLRHSAQDPGFRRRRGAAYEPVGRHHPFQRHGGTTITSVLARQAFAFPVAIWPAVAALGRDSGRSFARRPRPAACGTPAAACATAPGDFPGRYTRFHEALAAWVLCAFPIDWGAHRPAGARFSLETAPLGHAVEYSGVRGECYG